MKKIVLLSIFLSLKTFAATTTEFASYTQFGFCSGINFYFCSEQVENEAQQFALNQAASECSAQGGVADQSGDCSGNCFPFTLAPNAPLQSINCTADCNLSCTTK